MYFPQERLAKAHGFPCSFNTLLGLCTRNSPVDPPHKRPVMPTIPYHDVIIIYISLQERLAKAHGSQCGFCTPGMVMSMYTLLRNQPQPTEEELEKTLQGRILQINDSSQRGYKHTFIEVMHKYNLFHTISFSEYTYNNEGRWWKDFYIDENGDQEYTMISWWRHQMETFSALLAICAGNSPVI